MELPVKEKFALSIKEAAAYFHIGEKKLRTFAKEHPEVAVFMNRRYIILREEMEALYRRHFAKKEEERVRPGGKIHGNHCRCRGSGEREQGNEGGVYDLLHGTAQKRRRGMEKGMEKGRMETLKSLVVSKLLSLKDAAATAGMSEEKFKKLAEL